MFKKTLLVSVLVISAVVLSGCGVSTSGTAQSTTGSLFRSDNGGVTWAQKSSIMGVTRVGNFTQAKISVIEIDPNDHAAVYVGTSDNGMFYSYDSGDSFQWVKSLNKSFIRSIAIAPKYKCTIFASIDNKLYKSIDCARTWVQTYYDNDPLVTINSVVTDPKDGSKVYMATSRGEVIKSNDWGESWRTINRFDSKVLKLFINPKNGSYLYAATANDGLSISVNSGLTWQSLKQPLEQFNDGIVKDLSFSGESVTRLYIATRYGILKSDNNGRNWAKIDLITPKEKAVINAIAIDPTDDSNIYYTTNTTFYNSKDGGKNWTSKKLPTSRVGWVLNIDPVNVNQIFLGMVDLNK